MDWNHCTRCALHETRREVVLGRGECIGKSASARTDILFIGEGPGKSENIIGKPFVGRSGRLFDKVLTLAITRVRMKRIKYYITNTVACRPCDGEHEPNRQPAPEELLACLPRVQEVVDELRPRVIVFLGKVAENHLRKYYPEGIALAHPAYILRRGGESSPEFVTFYRGVVEALRLAKGQLGGNRKKRLKKRKESNR